MDQAALPFALSHSWAILLLPLLSFVINGIWVCHKSHRYSALISTLLSGAAFVWALVAAWQWWTVTSFNPELYPNHTLIAWNFKWLTVGALSSPVPLTIGMGGLFDPISVMMLVVVTTISFLVHIYSVGYMEGDPSKGRFFPLLSLFAFAMQGMVVSTNILQMYFFWELVGVSSYLLIGFWYHKPAAVAASKKAFIVTRFADAFFLLGIVLVSYVVGHLDFSVLNSPTSAEMLNREIGLGFMTVNALSAGTILIFTGGWGKSAMFPMHIWLPDAMEGPTPVSSIIHSATMVVAGIYLTARMFPLFAAAPFTLELVAIVGSFTAAFAAIIAITQRDIKRILAFSTLSQLGYMLFSLGVSSINGPEPGVISLGYSASMFHVFTHAFFKCMLFLVAGSVIHVVGSNMIDAMGGLRKKMPSTYLAALAGTLAIAGIPPFSGFWSKDEILMTAFQTGHTVIGVVGLLVGGLTALYMFRFFFLVFHGEARSDLSHAHEDPWMTVPIVILAVPSLVAGYLFKDFFHQVVVPPMETVAAPGGFSWLPVAASVVALIGTVTAWALYARPQRVEAALSYERPLWYKVIYDKFYIDEIWLFVTRKIIFRFVATPLKWFDRHIVDGTMNLIGKILFLGGWFVRTAQNGKLAFYLVMTVFGLIFIWSLGQLPI